MEKNADVTCFLEVGKNYTQPIHGKTNVSKRKKLNDFYLRGKG